MKDGADLGLIFRWGEEGWGECSSQMAGDDKQRCNATKALYMGSIVNCQQLVFCRLDSQLTSAHLISRPAADGGAGAVQGIILTLMTVWVVAGNQSSPA